MNGITSLIAAIVNRHINACVTTCAGKLLNVLSAISDVGKATRDGVFSFSYLLVSAMRHHLLYRGSNSAAAAPVSQLTTSHAAVTLLRNDKAKFFERATATLTGHGRGVNDVVELCGGRYGDAITISPA